MLKVEIVSCPLCGADRPRPALRAVDRLHGVKGEYLYVVCGDCGLVYMNPQVAEEDLGAAYPADEYEPFQLGDTSRSSGRFASLREVPFVGRFLRETVSIVAVGDAVAERLPAGSRWLDVGCGGGAYLARIRDRYGHEAIGVDISETAVGAARSSGFTVYHGPVHDLPSDAGPFDAISGWWYLEHVPDPVPVAARISDLLKPGGVVLLAVPNYTSLNARLFRSRWYHLDAPRHLTLWTPRTLRRLLEAQGLEIERFSFDRATWGLLGSLQYAAFGSNLTGLGRDRLRRSRILSVGLLPWTVLTGLLHVSDTVVVRATKPP